MRTLSYIRNKNKFKLSICKLRRDKVQIDGYIK